MTRFTSTPARARSPRASMNRSAVSPGQKIYEDRSIVSVAPTMTSSMAARVAPLRKHRNPVTETDGGTCCRLHELRERGTTRRRRGVDHQSVPNRPPVHGRLVAVEADQPQDHPGSSPHDSEQQPVHPSPGKRQEAQLPKCSVRASNMRMLSDYPAWVRLAPFVCRVGLPACRGGGGGSRSE